MTAALLTALFALAAAVVWGAGDYTNGLAARKITALHTTLIAYIVGLTLLVIVVWVVGEPLPPPADLAWGALAGLSGMLGLIFLMLGFKAGRMGVVAPVSAVLATIVPVSVTAVTEGLPGWVKLTGFGLALAAIWLLSRPEPIHGHPRGIGMALIAGLFFGGFFTLLDFVRSDTTFWPLVTGRAASVTCMLLYLLLARQPLIPAKAPLGILLLAGLLDVSGNFFFLNAVQTGRLDVAAVLSSFYPAVTAFLAWAISRERLTAAQVGGAAAAVVSIILITAGL